MIHFQLTEKTLLENNADSFAILVPESSNNIAINSLLDAIEQHYCSTAREILKKNKFEGKKGQLTVLHGCKDGNLVFFILAGLGKQDKKWHAELEYMRRALGNIILTLKKNGSQQAVLTLPNASQYKISDEELCKQVVITSIMTTYEFTTYKSDRTAPWEGTITLVVPAEKKAALATAVEHGCIIGEAMNQARSWCDTPGNIMTPTALSKEAEQVAAENNLACTVFGEDKAKELGMGAFLSVTQGSDQEGKFAILEYKTKEQNAPTIAIVGKGVTYDTGGISLKASNFMTGMQYDMSGAAAVIATMKIIAKLKPSINVVGLTPLVENMPSGKASRQDDIVRCMNGKTVEIKNTDAEGRLILSDALCYAEKFYNPAVIIDIATLTGACLYALGYFYTGLMTQDDDLLAALPSIGNLTGDRVWPLPLDDDFKPANNSQTADISNSGSGEYKAGTIIGACFLQEFVKNAKWAHLDIAGTADNVPGISYLGKGSAGAGIRLFTEFIMNYRSYITKS